MYIFYCNMYGFFFNLCKVIIQILNYNLFSKKILSREREQYQEMFKTHVDEIILLWLADGF